MQLPRGVLVNNEQPAGHGRDRPIGSGVVSGDRLARYALRLSATSAALSSRLAVTCVVCQSEKLPTLSAEFPLSS